MTVLDLQWMVGLLGWPLGPRPLATPGVQVVKILCSFGAATNKALIVDASDTGLVPLHAAAKNGHFEVPPPFSCWCPMFICIQSQDPKHF